VNRALPLPKYHQIYLLLREQLSEGRPGAALPGEIAQGTEAFRIIGAIAGG